MILAIAINAVLAAIVFTAVIVMIMRAIRSQGPATAAAPAPDHHHAAARAREHRAGGWVPARPWA